MLRLAVPKIVGLVVLVATTATFAGLGTVAGAVKSPFASTDPLPGPPVTDHATAELPRPLTVAVICLVPFTTTDSLFGETTMVCANKLGPLRPAIKIRRH